MEEDLPRCLMCEIGAALHISGKAILGSEIPKQTIMKKKSLWADGKVASRDLVSFFLKLMKNRRPQISADLSYLSAA